MPTAPVLTSIVEEKSRRLRLVFADPPETRSPATVCPDRLREHEFGKGGRAA
jgi:hypothetical protein